MRKNTPENPYPTRYDFTNCDKEPIHIIQTVQIFAAIIALDIAVRSVRQVSSNIYLSFFSVIGFLSIKS